MRISCEQGYQECYEILKKHGKTFYFMARLLGFERGRGVAAIYGFARTADDTVDEQMTHVNADQIQKKLNLMWEELNAACAEKKISPKFQALAQTIQKYRLPLYPFEDLLAGVEMDLTKNRYQTFKELELYCYRVAGTIGLMITPIAGFQANSRALEFSKKLGIAMQLTNILRDVGEDLRRNRIYFPKEDLDRFNISEEDLITHRNDDVFRSFIDFQIQRALALYEEGSALIPLMADSRGRLAFQFAIDAYSSILHKIRKNHYDVYTKRAHLTAGEKLLIIPKSWKRQRQNGNKHR